MLPKGWNGALRDTHIKGSFFPFVRWDKVFVLFRVVVWGKLKEPCKTRGLVPGTREIKGTVGCCPPLLTRVVAHCIPSSLHSSLFDLPSHSVLTPAA